MSIRARFIYHVIDSAGAVRYVGCTSRPETRLAGSIAEARMKCADDYTEGVRGRYYRWLLDELAADRRPVLRLIREAATDDWRADEMAEIHRLIAAGCDLLNHETKYSAKAAPPPGRAAKTMRIPVTPDEAKETRKLAKAAKLTLAGYVRDKMGLPPMPRGRPPKS